ncbi:keratin-associated protein 5-1-like [Macrobrachium nipponense]|uniref:keratin-associated protein 5-1-like n=1 Tax=Macrobrachium nipponense TaxID=159736 RepID=UPI0030C85488
MEDITTTRRRQNSCYDTDACEALSSRCVDVGSSSSCDATNASLCGSKFCTCCIITPCTQTTECTGYGGSCSKISAGCSGTSYDAGCAASTCTCCIADTSTCVTLPTCRDAGGLCIAPSQSGNCTGVLDPNGCLGDSCSCCKGGCEKTNKCTAVGGYCFRKRWSPRVSRDGLQILCSWELSLLRGSSLARAWARLCERYLEQYLEQYLEREWEWSVMVRKISIS